ncbi:fasciclin domain-containing protein (plasmid) [Cupriavidus pinatubonensis]|uniref:fasciclin domain-containing protein n=1 Tax=Cupriavidus pinatubonensis TaxID=248026 RepID=UPI001C737CB9|nr:fasciclin domain-containing protein [Cupriavidus pinatubonensis]QYY33889.1 fasciclin domain-containing protein [Cupriavidus pinatubonensis]
MSIWMKKLLTVLTVAFIAGCGGGDDPPGNVIQVAQSDSRFSILAEAIQTAGLTDTLAAPGPYTVFAPTNTAFSALLGELGVSKDQLFSNKALLTAVLKYHVVAGQVNSSSVPLGKAINPVGGGYFKIDKTGSDLIITDGRNRKSKIVQADIAASNGVIHAIDEVLLPADKTVVQTAIANPDFSILVEAVTAAGLADTLSAPGPFTVFAPTNAAFASLLTELGLTKAQLLANTALLTKVLTYHVVPGLVLKADVPVNTPIKTVEGETFTVSPALAITDQRGRQANIVATDMLASNGVIHVLDKVILPAP